MQQLYGYINGYSIIEDVISCRQCEYVHSSFNKDNISNPYFYSKMLQ